jgi:hypothetical protein
MHRDAYHARRFGFNRRAGESLDPSTVHRPRRAPAAAPIQGGVAQLFGDMRPFATPVMMPVTIVG